MSNSKPFTVPDILPIVSKYVRLEPRGTAHLGLCPFHRQKTRSFHVNQARGFYHCFGCSASGGADKFLRELSARGGPVAYTEDDYAECARLEAEHVEQMSDAEHMRRGKNDLVACLKEIGPYITDSGAKAFASRMVELWETE